MVDTVIPQASAPTVEDLDESVEETQVNVPFIPELAPSAPVLDDVPYTIPGIVIIFKTFFFFLNFTLKTTF